MFRTPCILAAFLMALVVLPAATLVSVSDIPGLDKAESPEVQEVLKKVWALQKAAPRTAHMKMHGTALGIKVQTEVWLGSGDIVAKTVNPDGTSMVEGMIGDTAFKVHDGKSMPMNEKQKLNQYLHAHPRMAMDMLFHAAKKITFSRGHEYGKKVNELMLHGVSSFGDIEIQFYEDGTIASNLTPMHGGMAKVINFGEYSDVQGHPIPHVMTRGSFISTRTGDGRRGPNQVITWSRWWWSQPRSTSPFLPRSSPSRTGCPRTRSPKRLAPAGEPGQASHHQEERNHPFATIAMAGPVSHTFPPRKKNMAPCGAMRVICRVQTSSGKVSRTTDTRSLTCETDSSMRACSLVSRSISMTCSTPPAPRMQGTPTK